ncbi:MAG: hypothetical protein GX683_07430 [Ruminococcaceae bacterium]|nr:hypothetical protein [Oscillospiraceae bacterium]
MSVAPKISVAMFSGLTVFVADNAVSMPRTKNSPIAQLLAYLLFRNNEPVLSTELIDLFWPEEASLNPMGALSNLVYRIRKLIDPFLLPDDTCIIFDNDSYRGNPKYPPVIDCVEFEELLQKAKSETDISKRTALLEKANSLYKRDFLVSLENNWTLLQRNYYHKLYIELVSLMCADYRTLNNATAVISICTHVLTIYPYEESVSKALILALLDIGNFSEALDTYTKTVDKLGVYYGADISGTFADVYKAIIDYYPPNRKSLDEITDILENHKHFSGCIYCGFAMFQQFYNLFSQSRLKDDIKGSLILVSLEGSEVPPDEKSLQFEMSILQHILSTTLRSYDAFTRAGELQFLILVNKTDENSIPAICNRIETKYLSQTSCRDMKISTKFSLI